MSHQTSFALNFISQCRSHRKQCEVKGAPLIETNTKTLKNINFAHKKCI